jgi:hypothetical protein
MKLRTKLPLVLAVLALTLTPAAASAGQPTDPGSQGNGVSCKDKSRKHVKGEKGTDFSQCVVAAAKS